MQPKILETTCNATFSRDLFVSLLANALFTVAGVAEVEEYEGIISKEWNYPEGYADMLADMRQEVVTQLQLIPNKTICKKQLLIVSQKTQSVMPSMLSIIARDDVILDVVGAYLLRAHFVVGREMLYKDFECLADDSLYAPIINTLDMCGLSIREKVKMKKIAEDVLGLA